MKAKTKMTKKQLIRHYDKQVGRLQNENKEMQRSVGFWVEQYLDENSYSVGLNANLMALKEENQILRSSKREAMKTLFGLRR